MTLVVYDAFLWQEVGGFPRSGELLGKQVP